MKPVLTLSALLLLPAPVAMGQDAGGTYVNIGEYTDDVFAPAPAQSMPMAAPLTAPLETYEIVTEPIVVIADPYVAPPIYSDVQYAPAPVEILPYRQPLAVAPAGFADSEYEAARLAAYDANRDGTVTTNEAIATLRPLTGQ